MRTISEYQSLREKIAAVSLTEIPELRPYARKHVEKLQEAGYTGAVIKQLCREAQSSRRTTDDAGLTNREARYAGLAASRTALDTAKQTKLRSPKSSTISIARTIAGASSRW